MDDSQPRIALDRVIANANDATAATGIEHANEFVPFLIDGDYLGVADSPGSRLHRRVVPEIAQPLKGLIRKTRL